MRRNRIHQTIFQIVHMHGRTYLLIRQTRVRKNKNGDTTAWYMQVQPGLTREDLDALDVPDSEAA